MNIEEMLLQDAAHKDVVPPVEPVMKALRPAMARASAAARLRRKRRKEAILFGCAVPPVLLMVYTTCRAALEGNWREAAPLLIAFGALSFFALFALPLLEKFLPKEASAQDATIRSVGPC